MIKTKNIFKLVFLGAVVTLSFLTISNFSSAATTLSSRLSGHILLQVEDNGEAWYVNPGKKERSYLGRPNDAFRVMREQGIGISSNDLRRIPFSLDYLSGEDIDGDKLPDDFEVAIGTNPHNPDSDGDSYDDYTEVLNGYDPMGSNAKKIGYDLAFTKKQVGKIFLDVERNGEAWYVNPKDNKRYFLGRPSDAFSLMRNLGLGITNTNLKEIKIAPGGEIKEEEKKQIEEPVEEEKLDLAVITYKPELMRDFSHIIKLSAHIVNSEGYDFKEKGFLYDYTSDPNITLSPTLEKHLKKVIDPSLGSSITANLDELEPLTYPHIRAYVITLSDEIIYGNVVVYGNTVTIDSIGKPGTPSIPSSGGGGGGGGSITPPPPPPPVEPQYYTLTYTASEGGYLIDHEINTNWQEKSDTPQIGVYASKQIIDDKLYIFGGYNYYCDEIDCYDEYYDSIFVYDPEEDTWNSSSSAPFLTEAENLMIDDKIYFFGGWNNDGSQDSVMIFDLSDNSWAYGASMPRLQYNSQAFLYNGNVYVFGSDYVEDNFIFDIYNPVNDEWLSGGDFSDYFSGNNFSVSGSVLVNDIFYFTGNDWNGEFNFISYDPATDTWEILEDFSYYSIYTSLVFSDDKLYTLGSDNDDNIFLLYYDLITEEWVELISFDEYEDVYAPYLDIINNKLFVIGGELYDAETDNYYYSQKNYYLNLNSFFYSPIYSLEQEVLAGDDARPVWVIGSEDSVFSSWSDGITDNPRTDLNVSADLNVTANFINTPYYTLTYQAEPGSYLLTAPENEESLWTENESLPNPLLDIISGVIGDKIYMYGGRSGGETYYTSLHSYDTKTDSMEYLDGYYDYRFNAAEIVYNDKLYFFGGIDGSWDNTKRATVFDPADNSFTSLSEMNNIHATQSNKGVAGEYNGEIYVFGSDDVSATFEIYNPETDTWRIGGNCPLNINNLVKVDNKFYFYTGRSDGSNIAYYSFDPETNIWESLTSMSNVYMLGPGINYSGDKIVYISGFSSMGEMTGYTSDMYVYDVSEDKWIVSPFNHGIRLSDSEFHLVVDDMYILGGTERAVLDLNIKTSIFNLPFEEHIFRVKEGQDGPLVLALNNDFSIDDDFPPPFFIDWSDGVTDNPRQDLNVQGDISVVSDFDISEYTITYSVGNYNELGDGVTHGSKKGNLVINEPSDWSPNAPLPDYGLFDLISGVVDDKIYVLGGRINREQYTDNSYTYDTQINSYEEISVMNLDNAFQYRTGSSDISIGTKIYSISGMNTNYELTASSSVFDTTTNTWSAIASPTYETYRAPIEVYNGEIYLFNGGDNVIEIYNPDANSWRIADTTPIPGIYDSELVDGVFYLQGEWEGVSTREDYVGYLAAFYPETNIWEARANDYANHIYGSGGYYQNIQKYNSFQNDQGIIMYLNDERLLEDMTYGLMDVIAIYDTTAYQFLDQDWNPFAEDHYSWSTFPKFSLGDLRGFDFYVIDDYVYIIGGIYGSNGENINMKMRMSNFPVNTYTQTVLHGQNGPKIYSNSHSGADLFEWSDNYSAWEEFRQDINIQDNIDVKAYFGWFT